MTAPLADVRRRSDPLESLRSGAWLTPARARAYGWIWFYACFCVAAAWTLLSLGGLDPEGKPLGTDFTSFWAAARLAVEGRPAAAYIPAAHSVAEIAILGRDTGYAAFFYPPIYLVICAPLGFAPYLPALTLWLGATGLAYIRAARAWLGDRLGYMPILAFPAVLVNAGHGQNGFLSAAFLGAGALWLEERPVLAGVCLGSLAYKPQLGLMIPIALAISRRWMVFAAAAVAVMAWAGLSVGLVGVASWTAFLADSTLARASLEQGLVGYAKMQSVFATVRLWGGPLALAYAAQIAIAAFATGGLVWLRRQGARVDAEGAAMIVAALLASPFLLDYDLVILAAPMAWMLRRGTQSGFFDWEKTALVAAFVLPAVSRMLASQAHLPTAPVVIGLLFLAVLRRGALEARSASN